MADIRKHFGWAVLASELSHVFCCVLPTVVTILGMLANVGLMTAAPTVLNKVHDLIHAYEVPVIIFSGVMVFLGWAVHLSSREVDCHDTGCVHPPCGSKKAKNSKILTIASVLFAINLMIYFGIHKNIFNIHAFDISKNIEHAEHTH